MRARRLAILVVVGGFACNGGERHSADARVTVDPPPEPGTVAISPQTVSLPSGGTAQFTAVARNLADPSLFWSADQGTIDQDGLYTAPGTGGVFHVKVTSRMDPARSAEASVSVDPPVLAISPGSVVLLADKTQQFTALVTQARDTRVSWSIAEGPAGGSIDRAGTYTAPPAPGVFHVVATSISDPRQIDTAEVTVKRPPGISVSVEPRTATIRPGATVRLAARIGGATDTRVVWTVDGGSIRADGLYTAPWTEGTYHVTAQSLADPAKIAIATVIAAADAGPLPLVEPEVATVEVQGLLVFRAHLPGTPPDQVAWTIQEGPAGGSIDGLGQYIAPADHEGTYHVIATSLVDPALTGTATVTVQRFDLVDNGGTVAASTRTFALWWGDPAAFPPDARTVVEALLGGLDGSPYLAVVDAYMRGSRASTSFGGSLFDPTSPPLTNPSQTVIADEACRALDLNAIVPGRGDMVFVFSSVFPQGSVAFCGWHSWAVCHGESVLIAYLPNPVGTACGGRGNGCNSFSLDAAALGTVAAHEFMEAVTDPFISAWQDALGDEIADKCFGLAACVPLGTGTLQLQPLYSNALHACIKE